MLTTTWSLVVFKIYLKLFSYYSTCLQLLICVSSVVTLWFKRHVAQAQTFIGLIRVGCVLKLKAVSVSSLKPILRSAVQIMQTEFLLIKSDPLSVSLELICLQTI